MKHKVAKFLMKLGTYTMFLGGATLALSFIVVILNGGWPEFLKPIQVRFILGNDLLGGFWFPALVGMVLSPGAAIYFLGEKLDKDS